jgi:hypothetical protein
VHPVGAERSCIPALVSGLGGDVRIDPQGREAGDELVDVAADSASVLRER